MSFILDALKKSEETRADNPLASVGRHPLAPPRRTNRKPLLWILVLLVPVLFLAIGWWLGKTPGQPGPVNDRSVATVTNSVTAPDTSSTAGKKATQPSEVAAEKALAPTAITNNPPETSPKKTAIFAPIPKRRDAPRAQEEIPSPPPPVTATDSAAIRNVVKPAAIQNFTDLARSTRQNIGPVAVSLHFFSPDPARRIIRINGVILHEGENVTDDLVVDEIRENSTIFSYRNQRFELDASGR